MACLDFLIAAQRNDKHNNSMSVSKLSLDFQNHRDDKKGDIHRSVAELLHSRN